MDIDASALSLEWETKLKSSAPQNIQAFLTEAEKLYRASTDPSRGTALALCIQTALDDEDGIAHPAHEDAMKVVQVAKTKIDSFYDHMSVVKVLAKLVRKNVHRDRWLDVLQLAIKKLVDSKPGLTKTVLDALKNIVLTDLESIALSALKRAGTFLCH